MAYLIAKAEGDESAFQVELPSNEEAILGRSAERANVVIPYGSVSGCHCSIKKGQDFYVVRDLGSTNGTRVNGVIVSEEKVFRGDKLSFGDFTVSLEGEDVPVGSGGSGNKVKNPNVTSIPVEPPVHGESAGMKIEPLSSKSLTVKVLPTQFKKKQAHGKFWLLGIIFFSLLAMGLIVWFVKIMVN